MLSVRTVPRPPPGPGQVLIRAHASSVNPLDRKIRSGAMRLVTGRRFPKHTGSDFAGEVVEVGSKVTGLMVGEHVDKTDLRPTIERIYPLDEIQDVRRATETGHARGKRVIRLV